MSRAECKVEAVDLFGGNVMRRSAIFVGDDRIELSRIWGPGPIACMIGCNPSRAGGVIEDPTCLWWAAWCRLFGFGGFRAVNMYPFVTSSPAECRRIADWENNGPDWHARDAIHFVNLPHLVKTAKAADQVFACWGNIAWDHDWIEHVVEEIQSGEAPHPDLWCWGTTKGGAPKHPMARGHHRIARDQQPILWRAA